MKKSVALLIAGVMAFQAAIPVMASESDVIIPGEDIAMEETLFDPDAEGTAEEDNSNLMEEIPNENDIIIEAEDMEEAEDVEDAEDVEEAEDIEDPEASDIADAEEEAADALFPQTIKLKTTKYVYDGKAKKPGVTIKDKGKTVDKSNYSVSYPNGRKNVGSYTVTISFKNKYSGQKSLKFTIIPKGTSITNLTPGEGKITVEVEKQMVQTTGYEIRYAANSSFNKAKTKDVSVASVLKTTISNLNGGTKYYFQVRSYKEKGNNKYYSKWSETKSAVTDTVYPVTGKYRLINPKGVVLSMAATPDRLIYIKAESDALPGGLYDTKNNYFPIDVDEDYSIVGYNPYNGKAYYVTLSWENNVGSILIYEINNDLSLKLVHQEECPIPRLYESGQLQFSPDGIMYYDRLKFLMEPWSYQGMLNGYGHLFIVGDKIYQGGEHTSRIDETDESGYYIEETRKDWAAGERYKRNDYFADSETIYYVLQNRICYGKKDGDNYPFVIFPYNSNPYSYFNGSLYDCLTKCGNHFAYYTHFDGGRIVDITY